MWSIPVTGVISWLLVAAVSASYKPPPQADPTPVSWPGPSESYLGNYASSSVVTDHVICSEIGRDMMIRGGNAVDAAIAVGFCNSVMNPHRSGLGGGHFMTIYQKDEKKCFIVDARETAPAKSTPTMYKDDPEAAKKGWLSVAVPGELHGFWTAFKRFGTLPWKTLVQPTIDLCRNGYPVSPDLAAEIERFKDDLLSEESLKDLFWNPKTQELYKEGEIMKHPVLAKTLERLVNCPDPAEEFYKGSMSEEIVKEFTDNGGCITSEDMASYSAKVREAIYVDLGNGLYGCAPPPPSSGAIVLSMLNTISGMRLSPSSLYTVDSASEAYHKLIEAMKYGFELRSTLGDIDFNSTWLEIVKEAVKPQYGEKIRKMIGPVAREVKLAAGTAVKVSGATHTSTVDCFGNAVALGSSLGQDFGARVRSMSTGIIWNAKMSDFVYPDPETNRFPPSVSNIVAPGKRPMSSSAPVVVYHSETGAVRLVIGANGASKILTGITQVTARTLWMQQGIKEAIDAPRLHNQLLPITTYERDYFPQSILDQLVSRYGQKLDDAQAVVYNNEVHAIEKKGEKIYANADFRAPGDLPSGY